MKWNVFYFASNLEKKVHTEAYAHIPKNREKWAHGEAAAKLIIRLNIFIESLESIHFGILDV